MTRDEALAVADAIVTGWVGEVKNQRGYVADGWKPVDVATRTKAVLQLAEFLLEQATTLVPPTPPATVFGWPLDGRAGPPSDQQYQAARSLLATHGGIRSAAETQALGALIEAHENRTPPENPATCLSCGRSASRPPAPECKQPSGHPTLLRNPTT